MSRAKLRTLRSSSVGRGMGSLFRHAGPVLLPSMPRRTVQPNNKKRLYAPQPQAQPKKNSLAAALAAPSLFAAIQKPPPPPPPPPLHEGKSIFEVGSPPRDWLDYNNKKEVDQMFGSFFEACSFCKNKFEKEADFYMYRYLSAFCSIKCRNHQRDLDGFDRKFNEKYAKMIDFWELQEKNNVNARNFLTLPAKPSNN